MIIFISPTLHLCVVVNFAQLSPQELLRETEKAVGSGLLFVCLFVCVFLLPSFPLLNYWTDCYRTSPIVELIKLHDELIDLRKKERSLFAVSG